MDTICSELAHFSQKKSYVTNENWQILVSKISSDQWRKCWSHTVLFWVLLNRRVLRRHKKKNKSFLLDQHSNQNE